MEKNEKQTLEELERIKRMERRMRWTGKEQVVILQGRSQEGEENA